MVMKDDGKTEFADNDNAINAYLMEGQMAFEDKDYDGAKAIFLTAKEKFPDESKCLLMAARSAWMKAQVGGSKKADMDDAIALFKQLEAENPEDPELWGESLYILYNNTQQPTLAVLQGSIILLVLHHKIDSSPCTLRAWGFFFQLYQYKVRDKRQKNQPSLSSRRSAENYCQNVFQTHRKNHLPHIFLCQERLCRPLFPLQFWCIRQCPMSDVGNDGEPYSREKNRKEKQR